MIILGCLAMLQVAWLPGWLATWRWRAPSLLFRLLVAFSLSLLINYVLVVVLVLIGGFTQPVVWGIFGAELLLGAVLMWRQRSWKLPTTVAFPIDWSAEIAASPQVARWLGWGIGLISLWAFGTIVARVVSINPGVFNLWDDFISFNRWALDWYQGYLPHQTQFYPQLIPANWAMVYKFIGSDDIQFFAKAIMGLFPVVILLSFFDLFYRYRKVAWLLGMAFTTLLLLALYNVFIGSGYVDIPVACLGWLAYVVLIPNLLAPPGPAINLVLSTVLVAAAALTKQAGLFMLLPLLAVVGLIGFRRWSSGRLLKWWIVVLTIFVLLAGSWYGYKLWQVGRGQDTSEVAAVADALERATGPTSWTSRLRMATSGIAIYVSAQSLTSLRFMPPMDPANPRTMPSTHTVWLVFSVWILLLILSRGNLIASLGLVTVVVPFYLVWAILYSYDTRNLTLILPFWGAATGFGTISLINAVLAPYWIVGLAVVVIGLVSYAQWRYPIPQLIVRQDKMMRSIGMDWLNRPLYDYYGAHGLSGKIKTMYQPLAYLPQLKGYALTEGGFLTSDALKNYDQDQTIHYVLWWDVTTKPDAVTYLQERIDRGTYTTLFEVNGYRFVKIKP